MDRRYQVFISSTFRDLVDERKEVIQALLELDCLPAGMEMFPATDEDQWTLIKKVIDQSDFYVVIVGGRYGSMSGQGISYTEMEYDYAVEQNVPVLGFVHSDPGSISASKTELDPSARELLEKFRDKVQTRHVKMYSGAEDLGSKVSRALNIAMRNTGAEGWVRGRYAMTPETQAEIAELRAQVSELKLEAESAASASAQGKLTEGLAFGDELYELRYEIAYVPLSNPTQYYDANMPTRIEVEWNELFRALGPSLLNEASESELAQIYQSFAKDVFNDSLTPGELPPDVAQITDVRPSTHCFTDVLVQFLALGITQHGIKERPIEDRNKYWALTTLGRDELMKLRAIPSRKVHAGNANTGQD